MTSVSMKELMEAGVHFGHQTRRWDPRMRGFIFTERNGIHIIDLQQTVKRLAEACAFVTDLTARGERILLVGTKKQARDAIELEAKRCSMPYVNNRWLGGTITNFATMQGRIDYLVRLEDTRDRGEMQRLLKKEALKIDREIERLNRHFGGIKEMTRLPGALFIIDASMERIACARSTSPRSSCRFARARTYFGSERSRATAARSTQKGVTASPSPRSLPARLSSCWAAVPGS